jgi:hypothetical protein
MPGAGRAEIYFISAMMVLILIVSFTAVYYFFREYRKEMRERELKRARKKPDEARDADNESPEDPRQ